MHSSHQGAAAAERTAATMDLTPSPDDQGRENCWTEPWNRGWGTAGHNKGTGVGELSDTTRAKDLALLRDAQQLPWNRRIGKHSSHQGAAAAGRTAATMDLMLPLDA